MKIRIKLAKKEIPEMAENVLILSTSPRKKGNSAALAEAFAEGARKAGNRAEVVSLCGMKLEFCRGCLACQKTGRCIIDDDVQSLLPKIHDADVLVFATPIYYYEMSGQMKTLIDRINPLFDSDYRFTDVYFLSAAAEDAEGVDARAIEGLGGFIDCFERAHFAGSVFAGGVTAPGEIAGHPALATAREMGRKA